MIDWNQIKTVFLDMDGTLLDLHFDNYFWLEHLPRRYAELKGVSRDDADFKLKQMYTHHHGSLNWYCLDFWTDSLDVDIVNLKREISGRIGYRPNARHFLQHIHEQGFDIALVTNAHQKSIELKLEQTDLGELINEIICSHDFQLPKEQTAFWSALKKRRPYNPSATAFFDDNEAVLQSAKDSGISHLYSIAQPDSQKAPRTEGDFPMLIDFMEILP